MSKSTCTIHVRHNGSQSIISHCTLINLWWLEIGLGFGLGLELEIGLVLLIACATQYINRTDP